MRWQWDWSNVGKCAFSSYNWWPSHHLSWIRERFNVDCWVTLFWRSSITLWFYIHRQLSFCNHLMLITKWISINDINPYLRHIYILHTNIYIRIHRHIYIRGDSLFINLFVSSPSSNGTTFLFNGLRDHTSFVSMYYLGMGGRGGMRVYPAPKGLEMMVLYS